MPHLIVEKGADRGRKIDISPGATIVIGRDTTANLVLSDTMASGLAQQRSAQQRRIREATALMQKLGAYGYNEQIPDDV